MDSLSQIALGAAVADAALGARIGRRALAVGAVLGTLPDLDVLVPFVDAVDSFTRHRSFSHSLFVLSFSSLPIAAVLHRLVPAHGPGAGFAHWWFACWAVLITHPLLDGFTVYGTQLFWPLPVPPVSIGSIFIIDPMYTVPLLVGLLVAWRHRGRTALCANLIGLSASSLWLFTTLVLQQIAVSQARTALNGRGTVVDDIRAIAFPFGLLWRVVALDKDEVLEGWVSLLDGTTEVSFVRQPRGLDRLGEARRWPVIERMDWFTGGYLSARELDGTLVLTDLRIGTASQPIFAFSIADVVTDGYRLRTSVARPPVIDLSGLSLLLTRIVDPTVELRTAALAGTLPRLGSTGYAD